MTATILQAKSIFLESADEFEKMIHSISENNYQSDNMLDLITQFRGKQRTQGYMYLLKRLRNFHFIYIRRLRFPRESKKEFDESERAKLLREAEDAMTRNNQPLLLEILYNILKATRNLLRRTIDIKDVKAQCCIVLYAASFLDLARIKVYMALLTSN